MSKKDEETEFLRLIGRELEDLLEHVSVIKSEIGEIEKILALRLTALASLVERRLSKN